MAQGYHLALSAAISAHNATERRSSVASHGVADSFSEYQVLNLTVEAHMTGTKPSSNRKDNPGFDPESPDLEDPQVDPTKPAKTPAGKDSESNYPPYKEDKK
ncbi:hypothetical protein K0038_01916 [Pseudomonas syringae]|nr:hypothetical protein [Pseudomonas syringae]